MNISSADELGPVFADVLAEVISTMSGFSFSVLSSERDADFNEMIGLMNLNGEKSGMLFVSAGEEDIRVLCSFMTGLPQNEVTKDDLDDALCELVNMTAGNAKLRLSGTDYTFNLSPPFIISGKNMSIITKKRTRVVSRVLGNDDISVKLKVVY